MPLNPEQAAKRQAKVQPGEPLEPATRYYRIGGHHAYNVARVKDHEYSYLDHQSGMWIPHPAVVDAVTGYKGDASAMEISEKQAQALIRRFTGKAGEKAE